MKYYIIEDTVVPSEFIIIHDTDLCRIYNIYPEFNRNIYTHKNFFDYISYDLDYNFISIATMPGSQLLSYIDNNKLFPIEKFNSLKAFL